MSSRKEILGVLLIAAMGFTGWAPAGGAQAASPSVTAVPASISPALTETHWNLTELNGSPVTSASPDNQPYIYLQTQAYKLSGSGGCNRLLGSYDLSGSSLEFHSVASTRMACPGNSMEHEADLLEALKLTNTYQISGDVLQLRVDERVLARFEPEKKR